MPLRGADAPWLWPRLSFNATRRVSSRLSIKLSSPPAHHHPVGQYYTDDYNDDDDYDDDDFHDGAMGADSMMMS